ncbi:MAG TPA: hypothetical protein VK084_10105 [Chitinophagaceae bacterium]|nr:hypothetical protein [Chitinophagaceae bacterium]
MLKYICLLGCLAFALNSCGGEGNENQTSEDSSEGSLSEAVSAVSSLSNMADEVQDAEKNYKKLTSLTPLTNDQLKAWMPEKLMAMKRTAYSIGGGYLSTTSLHATYSKKDKPEEIKIQLMDGADSIAASVISLFRISLARDFEQETQSHVKKTVEKDGVKAIEKYQKDSSRSTITFVYDERYYVELIGTNIYITQLWDAVNQLNLDDLGE